MDIRDPKWFGKVTITGVGDPFEVNGALISIMPKIMQKLQDTKIRQNRTGGTEINIRLSTEQESSATTDINALFDSMFGAPDVQRPPKDGESIEEYTQYLIDRSEGTKSYESARYLACDWFGVEPDPEYHAWLTDPLVLRFNLLNGSDKEYARSTPEEYASLKNYVRTTYPARVANFTFRTAD